MRALKIINNETGKKQKGAALMIIMIVLVLTVSAVVMTGLGKKSQVVKRDHISMDVLAKAKNALVGYAYVNDGALPCPDSIGNGLGDACSNIEGWLPWQTLGIKPLKDGDATCLRYAVSSSYRGVAPASLVDGDFEVQDENNDTRVSAAVAVVFAPLESLSGQLRGLGSGSNSVCGSTDSSADKNDGANYLDTISGVNNSATTPIAFIQADSQKSFNDVSIWLSTIDITGSIPVVCNIGEDLIGGVCQPIVCEIGEVLVGSTCEAIICDSGEELIGGVCVVVQVCDAGYSWDGSNCVDANGCKVGFTWYKKNKKWKCTNNNAIND